MQIIRHFNIKIIESLLKIIKITKVNKEVKITQWGWDDFVVIESCR